MPPRREGPWRRTAEKDAEIRDALRAFVASGDDERVFPGEYTRRDRWAVQPRVREDGNEERVEVGERGERGREKKHRETRRRDQTAAGGDGAAARRRCRKPLVTHPRDLRDAITALANAHATIGDSDGVRALMDELAQDG